MFGRSFDEDNDDNGKKKKEMIKALKLITIIRRILSLFYELCNITYIFPFKESKTITFCYFFFILSLSCFFHFDYLCNLYILYYSIIFILVVNFIAIVVIITFLIILSSSILHFLFILFSFFFLKESLHLNQTTLSISPQMTIMKPNH